MEGENCKTILITGSSGFLGRELLKQLSNRDEWKIFAYTSKKNNIESDFTNIDNIEFYDKKDWLSGEIPFHNVDVLVNCAFARSQEGDAIANSLQFIDNFISGALENGVKSVVNISSQSVYSQVRKAPANEGTMVKPESLYGMGKYSSEVLVKRICESKNIPHTNLRLASLVGLEFDVRLTNRFVDNAISDKPIKISGGKQIVSYMDVRDAADGILSLMNVDAVNWESVYNFGVEDSYSVKEVASMVKRIAPDFISHPVKIEVKEGDDFLNLSMDCTRFYNDMSWKPKYNMEKILKKQFQYIEDKKAWP